MQSLDNFQQTNEALPHQRIVEANAVMILIVRFGNGEIPAKTRAKDLANVPQASWDRTLGRLGSVRMWGKKSCEKGPVEVEISVSQGFCCLF